MSAAGDASYEGSIEGAHSCPVPLVLLMIGEEECSSSDGGCMSRRLCGESSMGVVGSSGEGGDGGGSGKITFLSPPDA